MDVRKPIFCKPSTQLKSKVYTDANAKLIVLVDKLLNSTQSGGYSTPFRPFPMSNDPRWVCGDDEDVVFVRPLGRGAYGDVLAVSVATAYKVNNRWKDNLLERCVPSTISVQREAESTEICAKDFHV